MFFFRSEVQRALEQLLCLTVGHNLKLLTEKKKNHTGLMYSEGLRRGKCNKNTHAQLKLP